MAFDPIEDGVRELAEIARGYAGDDCPIVRLDMIVDRGFTEQSMGCVLEDQPQQGFFPTEADGDRIEAVLGQIYAATRGQQRGAGAALRVEVDRSGEVEFELTFPTAEEAYGDES